MLLLPVNRLGGVLLGVPIIVVIVGKLSVTLLTVASKVVAVFLDCFACV